MLIDDIRAAGIDGDTLLDIGGGVGAIHHALLDAGATSAIHVDASPAYIDAAREESANRRHADRVRLVRGDFVELAPELPDADVVTLDRVICCYPDMESLVGSAADKARHLFGAVYPPNVWWMRLGVRVINLLMRVRRSPFRVFVHSPIAIEAVLRKHGLERVTLRRTIAWEISTFRR